MEHGGQLRGRQVGGTGEKAAGEDLEGQVSRCLGEIDALQEGLGVDVIEAVKDVGQ